MKQKWVSTAVFAVLSCSPFAKTTEPLFWCIKAERNLSKEQCLKYEEDSLQTNNSSEPKNGNYREEAIKRLDDLQCSSLFFCSTASWDDLPLILACKEAKGNPRAYSNKCLSKIKSCSDASECVVHVDDSRTSVINHLSNKDYWLLSQRQQ